MIIEHIVQLLIFLNISRLFCGLTYSLLWNMVHVNLKIMCMLLLLGELCYKCQLPQVSWYIVQDLLKLGFLYSFSSYWEQVLRSPTIIVKLSVSQNYCQILTVSFWFVYFEALSLGVYTFKITLYSYVNLSLWNVYLCF